SARWFVAGAWAVHSFAWAGTHSPASLILPASLAAVIVSAHAFVSWLFGHPVSRVLTWAPLATACATPARYFMVKMPIVPLGIILVVSSFALFIFGTFFALHREKLLA